MKILAIALIVFLQLIFSISAQELKPLVPVDEPISEQLQVVLADPLCRLLCNAFGNANLSL